MAKPDLTKNDDGHRFGTFGGVFTPSILCAVTLFAIAYLGAAWAIRAQYVILALLGLSIFVFRGVRCFSAACVEQDREKSSLCESFPKEHFPPWRGTPNGGSKGSPWTKCLVRTSGFRYGSDTEITLPVERRT